MVSSCIAIVSRIVNIIYQTLLSGVITGFRNFNRVKNCIQIKLQTITYF